jgi:hypothetical protein
MTDRLLPVRIYKPLKHIPSIYGNPTNIVCSVLHSRLGCLDGGGYAIRQIPSDCMHTPARVMEVRTNSANAGARQHTVDEDARRRVELRHQLRREPLSTLAILTSGR